MSRLPVSLRGGIVTDAAGLSRPLAVAPQQGWDGPTRGVLERVLDSASDQLRPRALSGSIPPITFIFVAMFVLIAGVVMVLPTRAGSLVGATILALASGALWFWTSRAGVLRGRYWRASVVDAWLEHRRCPSCAYPLSTELSGEQRGLWRCPECGGVWNPPSTLST